MSGRPSEDRTRWWRTRAFGSGALLVLIAALFVFSQIATDPGDNVTLVETTVEVRGPERFVTGALRNDTDDAFFRVHIEFVLLSADGRVLENVAATMLNLEAGETRRFETQVLADEAVRYRVERLTCSRSPDSLDGDGKPACYIPAGRHSGDL